MTTYIVCICMTVFFMLILILFVTKSFTLSSAARRGTLLSAALIIVCSSAECLGILLNGTDPVFRVPHMILKFIEL